MKEDFANQVRLEVATDKERFARKQDNTDRALAILMQGQAELIEMGTHTQFSFEQTGETKPEFGAR